MVLEHQAEMHNLITRANFDTRFALRDQRLLDEMTNTPPGTLSDSTRRRIAAAGDRLVDYMLFVNEAPLTSPVSGTSTFAEDFASIGPRDRQGRSLRTFDLETRLFKYPLSYLIYSEAFDSLPREIRRYVYWRLWQILTGAEESEAYAHLTQDIRKTLREILLDTRPELTGYLD
jgi:hypothetical protein